MIDRRLYAVIAAAAALILGGVAAFGALGGRGDDAVGAAGRPAPTQTQGAIAGAAGPKETAAVSEVVEPTKARGGEIAPPAVQPTSDDPKYRQPKRRPLAIMVENHPESRPQTGLDKADVVYEAPAEFGIPRFMALYITREAPVLGPVRSARGYYVTWASEYEPVYVHAGGSPQALSFLRQLEMRSIDALRYGGGGFERTSDRAAPHNLYTNTKALRQVVAKDKKLRGGKGSWGGLRFSKQPTVGADEGLEVTVTYEGGYAVTYYYDERSGLYKREMVGEPHLDRATKKQLTASAVIVQKIGMFAVKGDKYGRLEAQVKDEKAPALIFQNGRVIEALWTKAERDEPTVYTTKDGEPILLKPGQVWIQVAPRKTTKVEY